MVFEQTIPLSDNPHLFIIYISISLITSQKNLQRPCRISVLSCLNRTLSLGKCYLKDFPSFEHPVRGWHLPEEQSMKRGELHSLALCTRMSKHRASYPPAVLLSVMEPKGENLLLEGSQVDDR